MKIYDISQEVFGCQVFAGDPAPEKKQLCSIEKGDLCNLTAFGMCAHNGTHIDAPFHFIKDGLYEVDWLLFHLHGYQDGNRWSPSRSRNYASIPRCKHGEPCNSSVRCPNLCTAFRYCLCLACCTGWLACKLYNLLCGSQKIMAD